MLNHPSMKVKLFWGCQSLNWFWIYENCVKRSDTRFINCCCLSCEFLFHFGAKTEETWTEKLWNSFQFLLNLLAFPNIDWIKIVCCVGKLNNNVFIGTLSSILHCSRFLLKLYWFACVQNKMKTHFPIVNFVNWTYVKMRNKVKLRITKLFL